jgi:hypothetical protein
VIEVANDEPSVTRREKPMQERDRVAATRNADEVPFVWRKTAQGF